MVRKVQIAIVARLEQLVRVELRVHELVVDVALPMDVHESHLVAIAAELHQVLVR